MCVKWARWRANGGKKFDLLPAAPDVVSEPPAAKPEAILSLIGRGPLQLFDRMTASPVVWVGFEDGDRFGKRYACLLWMLAREFLQQTIETRRRANIVNLVHFFEERLGGFGFIRLSSPSSSPAGRLFPARKSSWLLRICSRTLGSWSSNKLLGAHDAGKGGCRLSLK
jgi:hypothetical protein